MNLQPRKNTLPGEEWTWLTSTRKYMLPRKMETRHLMNTILMIWNNIVPETMQTHDDVIMYRFSPDHTPEYMRQAVGIMFTELERRDLSEVPTYVKARWNVMRSWLDQPGFAEVYSITELRALPPPS